MSEPIAAEECDELAVAELAPARRYEPMVGTLVLVLEDENSVVEFEGPEGEARQHLALSTVKVERSAVGRPVELMFVEGDLDRPVITKFAHAIDLEPELRLHWDALAQKVLQLEPGSAKLADLVRDFSVFLCSVAWFEAHGNITHAANSLRMSRRTLRHYINVWREQNPHLVPSSPPKPDKAKVGRPGAEARTREGEGDQ